MPLLENGVLHVSVITMVAMTTERFYSINYPLKQLVNRSETMTIRVILSIWVTAFVVTSPFLVISIEMYLMNYLDLEHSTLLV